MRKSLWKLRQISSANAAIQNRSLIKLRIIFTCKGLFSAFGRLSLTWGKFGTWWSCWFSDLSICGSWSDTFTFLKFTWKNRGCGSGRGHELDKVVLKRFLKMYKLKPPFNHTDHNLILDFLCKFTISILVLQSTQALQLNSFFFKFGNCCQFK